MSYIKIIIQILVFCGELWYDVTKAKKGDGDRKFCDPAFGFSKISLRWIVIVCQWLIFQFMRLVSNMAQKIISEISKPRRQTEIRIKSIFNVSG